MPDSDRWLEEVARLLRQSGCVAIAGPVQSSTGIQVVSKKGYDLHLGPDRVLTCAFRVDLDDVRALISDDTTEDLSDDELCRVAREELRPFINRCRFPFIQAGFEEAVGSDQGAYVVAYRKDLQERSPQEASHLFEWCRKMVDPA